MRIAQTGVNEDQLNEKDKLLTLTFSLLKYNSWDLEEKKRKMERKMETLPYTQHQRFNLNQAGFVVSIQTLPFSLDIISTSKFTNYTN